MSSVTVTDAQGTILTMNARSRTPKPVYYSCGWLNRVVGEGKLNRWHTGSLPGTAALVVRRHDGRNWVVLFNARVSPHASHLAQDVDPLVHQAADEVQQWPKHDLFGESFLQRVLTRQTAKAAR